MMIYFTLVVLALALLFSPVSVRADSVNGFLDYLYSSSSTKSTDSSGQTTKTNTTDFLQRYSLLIDKTIFPKIKFNGGGIFEKDLTKSKSVGPTIDSTDTKFRPYATLTLKDPFYYAGVGYYLREETIKTTGSPHLTTLNEDYETLLGWKPEGLPSMDLRAMKTNTYDESHTVLDTTKDYVSLISRYASRGFDLQYYGTYQKADDKLKGFQSDDVTHNGRGSYSNSFLDGRLTVGTTYNFVQDTLKTSSTVTGAGTVSIRVFASAALSTLTDTPTLGALSPNPALIDGNLTLSAGVDIGLPPLGGDLKGRDVGLDLLNGTSVNNLLVWVDRELPTDISSSFSWDVYTSSDNLNWTFLQTVFPAPFGPFQNSFSIDFGSVTTRYIKVVVRPLQATANGASRFPDIFITELQAFVKQPAQVGKEQKFVTTTQISNSDVRYRIFNAPLLYYDVSYYFAKTGISAQEMSTLSNALSVSHQLTRAIVGTARLAREDGTQSNETTTAWVYNASLLATPIPTFTSGLVLSGRNEQIGGQPRDVKSIFLNNTAQLYRGIDMNLNGGWTSTSDIDGTDTKSILVSLGANVIPHRTMTWSFFLSHTATDRSIPGQLGSSTTIRRGDVTLAYNPFRTLYLLASLDAIDETGLPLQLLQNYGLNWSPFPDGALQFRFLYNESRRSQDQFTERIISPGVRYNINRSSFLDLSYQKIKSDSSVQKIDSGILSIELKIFL